MDLRQAFADLPNQRIERNKRHSLEDILVLTVRDFICGVNAYCSRWKGWMKRCHGVATRYFDYDLGWHRMLDNPGQRTHPVRHHGSWPRLSGIRINNNP